jgi:hypothetical protein
VPGSPVHSPAVDLGIDITESQCFCDGAGCKAGSLEELYDHEDGITSRGSVLSITHHFVRKQKKRHTNKIHNDPLLEAEQQSQPSIEVVSLSL